tara:strand:+ start:57 stop:857 length:801 start_codon:yes stop_codon:yes gene_type:complete
MNIPKTIIQTYSNEKDLSLEMRAVIQDWKNKNKNYKHILFYDEDCVKFIKKHFNNDVLTAFNTIKPGAGKADLFRYCYLYIKGGVYSDIDNICIKPLDLWLKENDKFVSILDYNRNNHPTCYMIHQSFIACIPNHPFLKEAIKLATYNILNQVTPINKRTKYLPVAITPLLKVTGPKLLADAVNICLNRSLNTVFTIGNQGDGFRLPAQLTYARRRFNQYQPRQGVIKSNSFNGVSEIFLTSKYEGYIQEKEKHWVYVPLYNKFTN